MTENTGSYRETAAEFMARLAGDPEYTQGRVRQEQRHAERRKEIVRDSGQLVAELNDLGYAVES